MTLSPPLKAVALMGATGTGKSALAMDLASKHNSCIISCDSMQVYRGLDIGTAKPSQDEQQQVRHALIDCADVNEIWSAQIWADAARVKIKAENEQGKVPIIVGGTGMYLKALLEGFAPVPLEKEGVREKFEAAQAEKGIAYLYGQLENVDKVLAERLKPQDSQRIIRGLSVFESTGVPLSVWQQKQQISQAEQKNKLECPVFVLELEREILRERLATRCKMMMGQGWLQEVQWLHEQDLASTHPVMRAVGYRQLMLHVWGETTLDTALTDAITATRRYAKRQRTWFKNQTPHALRGEGKDLLLPLKQHLDFKI